VTIGTAAIAAGWYKDPAGSSALRWWDGTQWTNHLQQSAPPAPPQPPQPTAYQPVPPVYAPVQQAPAAPELSLSSYSPMTGYAQLPRDNSLGNDPYSGRARLANVPVNNAVAWVSFVAGLVSIASIFAFALFPGSYFLPVFGLTAIITGARAISRHRRGSVTVLWAPIIGLVLGLIAEFILILGIIFAATGVGTTPTSLSNSGNNIGSDTGTNPGAAPASVFGPTGSTTNYDMGVNQLTYLPTSNGTLSQSATTARSLVAILQQDYANGKAGTAANGSWPISLTYTQYGAVTASDGRDLGYILTPGDHLAYSVESDGSFLLEISGANTTELAVYASNTTEYLAWCEASDNTCKTSSPVPPLTSTRPGTSTPTTAPTTT
jgi:hypothetical protein